MKTLPIYAAAIALLSGVGAANAADVYQGSTKDGASVTYGGNPFAGFNGSVGLGVASLGSGGNDETDFRGDVRAGYNFVSKDGFLVGVYAEGSLLDVKQATASPFWGYGAGVKLGKVLGPQFLAYIDGGWDALEVPGLHIDGYKVGGGVEYLITPRWSIGPEIDYVNYGAVNVDGVHAMVRTTLYLGN